MATPSKNAKFRDELKLKLKTCLSDLILQSDILQRNEIREIVDKCEANKIKKSDIKIIDKNLADYVQLLGGFSRDAITRDISSINRDDFLSKIIKIIIGTILGTIHNPYLKLLDEIQKELEATINISTGKKSVTFDTKLYSWSKKPFVRFVLATTAGKQSLVTIRFQIDTEVKLKDVGIKISKGKNIPTGSFLIDSSLSLREIERYGRTIPINLQFGSCKFEIGLPSDEDQ